VLFECSFAHVPNRTIQDTSAISACPEADAEAAAEIAEAICQNLKQMLSRDLDLVLAQQRAANPKKDKEKKKQQRVARTKTKSKAGKKRKKTAAPKTSKTKKQNPYTAAMASFIDKACEELSDLFPKKKPHLLKKAARQMWLDSEERLQCISAMSSPEKRRRRFKTE
jgi:hypothetical protein